MLGSVFEAMPAPLAVVFVNAAVWAWQLLPLVRPIGLGRTKGFGDFGAFMTG